MMHLAVIWPLFGRYLAVIWEDLHASKIELKFTPLRSPGDS
jgi:hypothetical protein